MFSAGSASTLPLATYLGIGTPPGARHPWRRPGAIETRNRTMTAKKQLKATARPEVGKGAARAARRAGQVPGVIYGDKQPPVAISLDSADLTKRIYAGHFLTTLFDVEVGGTKHQVIPRAFQLDPLHDKPTHVDFQRVAQGA